VEFHSVRDTVRVRVSTDCGSDFYIPNTRKVYYFKLMHQHSRYDLRKYYFINRVGLVPIWNSLPNDAVMADNINLFEKRLDKFWSSYDFVYLFTAQPLGTGSAK